MYSLTTLGIVMLPIIGVILITIFTIKARGSLHKSANRFERRVTIGMYLHQILKRRRY